MLEKVAVYGYQIKLVKEKCIRDLINIVEMQFGFIPGVAINNAIFIMQQR